MAIIAEYINSNSFSVANDQTQQFDVGRRVKLVGGSIWYGTIETSIYTTLTTITLTPTSDDIDGSLTEVFYGIISGTDGESAMPLHDHEGEGSGGQLDHTTFSNIGTKSHATIDSSINLNTGHRNLTTNPHNTTKAQVGLSDVSNTDFTTPVSDNTTHRTTISGNPHQVTKSNIGLADVPNTDFTSTVSLNTAKTTNATHTGEVTGSGTLIIVDNVIDEANLKLDEAPTNNYILTADSTKSGGMKWTTVSSLVDHSELDKLDYMNSGHTGFEASDVSILKEDNVDDTPVNDATTAPISSNWAHDHSINTNAHHSEVHTVVSHNDTEATGLELNTLVSGVDTTLHYHSTDRDRTNHTGTQTVSTISDFDTEVSNNSDVALNTTHRTSDGSDHTFIDQDLTISGSPTFSGIDIDGDINISLGHAYKYDNLNMMYGDLSLNNYFTAAAGNLTMTGHDNNGNGAYSLSNLTTGIFNTAMGSSCLYTLTTGEKNTGIGYGSLYNTITTSHNTAIGFQAAMYNEGSNNTAIGRDALLFNSTGSYNTVIGSRAMEGVWTTSIANTAVGYQAGFNPSYGSNSNNSLFGYKAGYSISTGSNNIIVGYQAGDILTTGNYNIIIGDNSDTTTATSSNELNIGNVIYGDLTTGNIGIGTTSLPSEKLEVIGKIKLNDIKISTPNSSNIYMNQENDDITGEYNFCVGTGAGRLISSGDDNVVIGRSSGYNLDTGSSSVFIGYGAGSGAVTGNNNFAIGYAAGKDVPSSTLGLVVLGSYAGQYGANGVTALGQSAARYSGPYTIGIGYNAMNGVSGGDGVYNIGMGYQAGYAIDSGDYNVLIGYRAGNILATGNNNIMIGKDVDPTSASASDELNIGDTIYGDLYNGYVGIGTDSPDTKLDVDGAITQRALSVDPLNPDDGACIKWLSDGTDFGDAGDICMAITVSGTTKKTVLVDFSTL